MELPGAAGGDRPAKLSSSDAAGEDRLSALPDDVLVLILLCRCSAAHAARTSVLSRRWRRVWALLPKLHFRVVPEPHRLRDVLDAHEVPISDLHVMASGATPESLATWLPAAARRVSGGLFLMRGAREEDEAAVQRGPFEFPCFEKATSIVLFLGFVGLTVPPAGVFARLTALYLSEVHFHGPGELGHPLSSPRCPCLQRLSIQNVRGLGSLAIHSKSLLQMQLWKLSGLSQLTIVAPVLKDLFVESCFQNVFSQPGASISAPQLVTLGWRDAYDPSSMQLGIIANLRQLNVFYYVYGEDGLTLNDSCLRLLQHFKAIRSLSLSLEYLQDIEDEEYLMEDMTVLPDITFLFLTLHTNGHAFGNGSFHVLRLCAGIRRLRLRFSTTTDSEAQAVCPSDCICDQPSDWETEELRLNHLKELEIDDLRGSEHEVAFVKRLFNWGTELKEVTVNFSFFISEIVAKELYQIFQSFTRPGICMKFYILRKSGIVLYAPED